MKLYIIANRLPVKVQRTEGGGFEFQRSEGGLATGLASLDTHNETHWIGWPGIHTEDPVERAAITEALEKMRFHPVFLNETQILNYYEGYSNNVIWPLCHYFYAYMEYQTLYWESYKEVNELFLEKAESLAVAGDVAWVQDYQLMLLPKLLRERIKGLSIGYFHHIPFPSYELFRVLPERAELLEGLLGADLIAFHTHDYMRHFVSAVERVLLLRFALDRVIVRNRTVHVDALPMGINFDLYHNAILDPLVQEKASVFREDYGGSKLVLSVDRLDYSKGILHRLKGFELFLKENPAYLERVSLVMIVVPSRDRVERYAELKKNIDETIGNINGAYSTMNWTPVYYFYHGLPFEELLALYHIADIALVSPLRDGMNLVAKEYVAAKRDQPGVLILSEMAGAAIELSDAVTINPNDVVQISDALSYALDMSKEEQLDALKRMQAQVSRHSVHLWAKRFMDELMGIRLKNMENDQKRLVGVQAEKIRKAYRKAKSRLFILDYDGTLSAFNNRPEDAKPNAEILDTLIRLTADPMNKVVISSGRDHTTLENWLGHLNLDMAAEHGAFYKEKGVWHKKEGPMVWDAEILSIFQAFIDKTPRSKLEMKETALVWHYRRVDAWLGTMREQQLVEALMEPCSRLNLQIMRGDKIIEVKSPNFTKGSEAKRLLKQAKYDFICAIGDDTTDEDTFRALPKSAITIKVGGVSDQARYYVLMQAETLPLLNFWMDDTSTSD